MNRTAAILASLISAFTLNALAATPASKPASQPSKVVVPKSTFFTRAKERKDDKDQIAYAKRVDGLILKYLSDHKVADEKAAALWAGKPLIGMTEEEVRLVGFPDVTFETEDMKRANLNLYEKDDYGRGVYRITITRGQVDSIAYK